jgi:hypothetical protein
MAEMKKALAACYAEAEAKDVLQGASHTTGGEMLGFLGEAFISPTHKQSVPQGGGPFFASVSANPPLH